MSITKKHHITSKRERLVLIAVRVSEPEFANWERLAKADDRPVANYVLRCARLGRGMLTGERNSAAPPTSGADVTTHI